ncbi:MAG: protein kinase [Gemmatimonadaceae bacterium]
MLFRDGSNIPWVQRGWQRAALFALLAASGKRGIDRELLATLLWPDSAEPASRHSLDELLSRARKEVGCKELFAGTSSIAFNTEFVNVDLEEFERAVTSEHLERAVQLYEGPFAEGLRLSAADDIERRLTNTRQRFAELFRAALERLAKRAEERGDHMSAVQHWQRAAREDPLSGRIAKALVNALVSANEHARAIAHLRVFRALVLAETGTEAPTEFADWEHQLRKTSQVGHAIGSVLTEKLPKMHLPRESTAESVRERLLKRSIERSYILGTVIEEGSLVTRYEVKDRETARAAELHVLGIHVNGLPAERQFTETFNRVQKLSHAGVIPILDAGIADGTAYWISAMQPRETLREILRRKRGLAIEEALLLGRAIAAALRYAHSQGVTHGDLRPKRIGIVDGQPILSGFGLVEALLGRTIEEQRSTTHSLGAPMFQSPEQLWDRAGADIASDIYAFGCIAYEMFAGEAPFGSASGVSLVRRKLTGDVVGIRQLRKTVSVEVETMIMQCLSRLPSDRGSEVPLL